MNTSSKTDVTHFKNEVDAGLSKKPKSISSKFFYDEYGDALFQQIMNLKDYYLTESEYSIFKDQKEDIVAAITSNGDDFNLIELGAGDGSKTKILLEQFIKGKSKLRYYPVDISKHILHELKTGLTRELPEIECHTINEEYFSALKSIKKLNDRKNVIFFLGSNIGNFNEQAVNTFFETLSASCSIGDKFFLGVDLKKDPECILKAYSDREGITAKFNLNLLKRANRELGADFDLSKFKHYASYNPENGEARSYIISLCDQKVHIRSLNKDIHFLKSEFIHTEISKKYNLSELDSLAEKYGFKVEKHFTDHRDYFVNTLWTLKEQE